MMFFLSFQFFQHDFSYYFSRLPLPAESKDTWFASHLVCPVVLRRILCGKEGDSCRCSTYSIPEVTDLEYDYLISEQLSSIDQIVIVCVFSALEKGNTIKEVAEVYREQNRTRSMPCIQVSVMRIKTNCELMFTCMVYLNTFPQTPKASWKEFPPPPFYLRYDLHIV